MDSSSLSVINYLSEAASHRRMRNGWTYCRLFIYCNVDADWRGSAPCGRGKKERRDRTGCSPQTVDELMSNTRHTHTVWLN